MTEANRGHPKRQVEGHKGVIVQTQEILDATVIAEQNLAAALLATPGDPTETGELFVTGEQNLAAALLATPGDPTETGELFVTGEQNLAAALLATPGDPTETEELFVTGEQNLAAALLATPGDPTETGELFASIPPFQSSSTKYQNNQGGYVQAGWHPTTQTTTTPPAAHPSIQMDTYDDAQKSGFFPHLNQFFPENTRQHRPFVNQPSVKRVKMPRSTIHSPVYLSGAQEPTFDCLSQAFFNNKE
jgi:hypothetical protein